ncbi:MAG: ATP-binding protein [Candidatus Wallbacteria bacterium]|nr:ATP-binding protein [Candidatus Wallbacteria bacterium]
MSERENDLLKEISDLKDAYFNLLSSLYRLSEAVSFKFRLEELFQIALELLNTAHPFYYGSIYLTDEFGYQRRFARGNEANASRVGGMSNDLFPWVTSGKKVSVLPDFDETSGKDLGSVVMIPLLFQDDALGLICLLSEQPADQYVKQDQELFTIIGNQTAVAIKNAMLYSVMEDKNRELGNLKNYLENILENMANAIIVSDLSGTVTAFNRSAEVLTGKKSEEVIGRHYLALFGSGTGERISMAGKNAVDLARVEVIEEEIEAGGRKIPVEITISPVRLIDKGISDFIISCRDLSQTREIERLRDLDRMKSELLSNVSHELKTPLTSIKAYSETLLNLLDSGENDPETEREFIGIIDKEAERLTALIDELLTFSRLEDGRVEIRKERFDLEEMIREIITLMKESIRKKEIRCVFDLHDGIFLMSDKEKVKQILVNLVGNAIKYNKDRGMIKISTRKVGDSCLIKVVDTGLGIPRESLPKIFERFYRVDNSLTYEVSGTGLGLAICRDLSQLCGGRIGVKSRVKCGSVFELYLPLEN